MNVEAVEYSISFGLHNFVAREIAQEDPCNSIPPVNPDVTLVREPA